MQSPKFTFQGIILVLIIAAAAIDAAVTAKSEVKKAPGQQGKTPAKDHGQEVAKDATEKAQGEVALGEEPSSTEGTPAITAAAKVKRAIDSKHLGEIYGMLLGQQEVFEHMHMHQEEDGQIYYCWSQEDLFEL